MSIFDYTYLVTVNEILFNGKTSVRVLVPISRPLGLACLMGLALSLSAQEPPDKLARRYGLDVNPEKYPQAGPQETVRSIVKAVKGERVDYLLAHLADPDYVDKRVAEYRNQYTTGKDEARTILAFSRLVRETQDHFLADPSLAQDLLRFAADGDWDAQDATAVGKKKGSPRVVFLKKIGDRWFLENKQQK